MQETAAHDLLSRARLRIFGSKVVFVFLIMISLKDKVRISTMWLFDGCETMVMITYAEQTCNTAKSNPVTKLVTKCHQ